MTNLHTDALVFFGATGDLAYKKIFPALQGMVERVVPPGGWSNPNGAAEIIAVAT